uniref:Uncharacterized protein n=1 Tax=Candidatus Kentrum sp. LFY TaxID=2126342 RepID=A0A450UGI3_9GAMM|nr:MAG: hypothetical protein BECKLFY1418B_GA0070995_102713 [Candidatus Kentron sp. LFY]
MDGLDSVFEESDLRGFLGSEYSEEMLKRLQELESFCVRKRVEISTQAAQAEISFAQYAIELNKLSEQLLEKVTEIAGSELCKHIFDVYPGEGFQLVSVEECAREDTKRIKHVKNYGFLYPRDPKIVENAIRFVEKLSSDGARLYLDLSDLLQAIESTAKEKFIRKGRNEVWFALHEINDILDPFFPFIAELCTSEYNIIYSSGNRNASEQTDSLRRRLVAENIIDNIETARERIGFRSQISNFLTTGNFCFIVNDENPESRDIQNVCGFLAFLSDKDRTIGGKTIPQTEARKRWLDLSNERMWLVVNNG